MKILILVSLSAFLFSCQATGPDTVIDDLTWTIDTEYMRQGCYGGRDCIPSLERPSRSEIGGSSTSFLSDNDLVVGVWNGTDYVAYPHNILDWHEIINEDGYAISYCPLTGSAINISTESEYGVSGLLYNSNLIMYDRDSDSYWPQMLLRSAAGDLSGNQLHLNNVVETSWGTWKKLYPTTKVINSSTGFSRNYTTYPYGNYKDCNSASCRDYIYFPVAAEDDRLPAKKRVLTLINGSKVKAIDISTYTVPTSLTVDVDGKRHIVIVSANDNIAVAFETVRKVSIDTWDIDAGTIILKDSASSNRWDITGNNLADSTSTDHLKAANGYIAFWFSVAAFYPDTEIVSG